MKIVLGTVQFGLHYGINNLYGKPNSDQVFQILDYASENGIESLDTADSYGNAEMVLGNYNENNGTRFTINTKFKINNEPVSVQLLNSLHRLQTKSIGTYFYHSFADYKSKPEILTQLKKLKSDNLIQNIGVSVYSNEQLNDVAMSEHINVIQLPFNMLDNRSKRFDYLTKAKDLGKKIQVRSVFLQGLFFKPLDVLDKKLLPLKCYLEQLHKLSADTKIDMEKLALQYVACQSTIDEIIIGVDNIDQLRKNLAYVHESLDPAIINEIDKITVTEEDLLLPVNWN
jgi:aryl-alcohol dehydrogenase-like predicted oxidoreductase